MGKLRRIAPLLAVLLVVACAESSRYTVPPGSVEIRQYQGQDLSAISDMPETDIAGPQRVSLDKYRLKVSGLVNTPLELTYDQVLGYDRVTKVVTLHCVEGWDATILWEGVAIKDILAAAGVRDGAPVVIFHAVDGYTSSLPLAFVQTNDILLAFKMNGLTLPAELGFPFQVVAESKWGYKWVKWVDGIELSSDTSYRGYWETRGYDSNGDQSGPILEP
ncbi:MAG: molybdopterin-dependent oxidoreductase [Candidatus Limnocylindrales bacterium]